MTIRLQTSTVLALAALVLAGCSHTGSRSPNARPVLYPNATFKQIGETRALEEVDVCGEAASHAGLTPDEKDNAVGRSAAKDAAVGGAGGAVAGAFQEKPNMTYRHFVQRCVSEKGLEVIGWN